MWDVEFHPAGTSCVSFLGNAAPRSFWYNRSLFHTTALPLQPHLLSPCLGTSGAFKASGTIGFSARCFQPNSVLLRFLCRLRYPPLRTTLSHKQNLSVIRLTSAAKLTQVCWCTLQKNWHQFEPCYKMYSYCKATFCVSSFATTHWQAHSQRGTFRESVYTLFICCKNHARWNGSPNQWTVWRIQYCEVNRPTV
jgi:hypothetical protein